MASAPLAKAATEGASDARAVNEETRLRLLQHANDVRKHASLVTLDSFLEQSGHTWIEVMIGHARDSYDSYVHSRFDVDSTLGNAFEHRMTAELLKTPSPKKKSTAANMHRFAIGPMAIEQPQEQDARAIGDADKENRPAQTATLASPMRRQDLASPISKESHRMATKNTAAKDASRATRSKGDRSDVVMPANLFEARLLEAKKKSHPKAGKAEEKKSERMRSKAKKEIADANTVRDSKTRANDSRAGLVAETGELDATVALEQPSKPKDAGSMHKSERGLETSSISNSEGDTKTKSTSRGDEITLPWESMPASPGETLQTAPVSPEKAVRSEKSSTASTAYVSASINAHETEQDGNVHEHLDSHEKEQHDDGTAVLPTDERDLEEQSPRESTPPPKSPSKQQLAEVAAAAMQKLEASLLKLDDDIVTSGRVSFGDLQRESAQGSDPNAETLSDDECIDARDTEQKERRDEILKDSHSENSPHIDERTASSSALNKIDDAQSVKPTLQPKRTLSSIAHAKRSIASSSVDPQSTNGGSSATRKSSSKGSFLSKSLAQAEMDPSGPVQHRLGSKEVNTLPSTLVSTSKSDTIRKRKSDEEEVDAQVSGEQTIRGSKAQKANENIVSGKVEAMQASDEPSQPTKAHSKTQSDESSQLIHKVAERTDSKQTRISNQPQSLREKIESFHSHKSSAASTTQANWAATRNVGSLSTHNVGIGAKKLSSPIFSRTGSQSQFQTENPDSDAPAKQDLVAQFKERETSKVATESPSSIPRPVAAAAASTTPTQSPSSVSRNIYPSIKQSPTRIPAPVKGAVQSPQRSSPMRKQLDDTLSDSDADAFDGTSSDGDLSLVDLRKTSELTSTVPKAPATVPRPPGSQVRASATAPKTTSTAHPSSSKTIFMPSSSATRDQPAHAPAARSEASASTAPLPASSQSVPPSTPHGGWGGSISSKLKGILGFATPGTSSASMSKSKVPGPSSIVRKESTGASGNVGARPAPPSVTRPATDNKKASAGDRLLTTQQVAKKASERELNTKSSVDLKKRARDEPTQTASVSSKNKLQAAVASSLNRQGMSKTTTTSKTTEAPDAKRRKTNEAPNINGIALAPPANLANKTSYSQLKTPATHVQKPASTTVTSTKTPQTVKPQPSRPQTAQAFTDQNPFQKAQSQQQDRALASVSKQLQQTKQIQPPPYSQTGKGSHAAAVPSTAQIELEEPDSAYSDSEDEETIRRRMQHKPWETRDGLAKALEAQSTVDADMIFGIPQGAVPLDEILPAQTDGARNRRMRPRSSSATWSRDGLKQFEIDRYNERMGIQGPGVKLSDAADAAGAGRGREGATSPSRANRLSSIAQSAIAQGQVSRKPERTSMQYR